MRYLVLNQTVFQRDQIVGILGIEPRLDLILKFSSLKLQFSSIIKWLLHTNGRTNLIVFVTSWRKFFQGLTQQIFLKLQLLVIVEVHDLTASAAIINLTRRFHPKFRSLVDGQELGLDKVTLNPGHLTVDFLAFQSPWHKDQRFLIKSNPFPINSHFLNFQRDSLLYFHIHASIIPRCLALVENMLQ